MGLTSRRRLTREGRRPPKDAHWYDVQQKFDLAKAYQEMGDRDGARDILREVLKEGDQDQRTQATQLSRSSADRAESTVATTAAAHAAACCFQDG